MLDGTTHTPLSVSLPYLKYWHTPLDLGLPVLDMTDTKLLETEANCSWNTNVYLVIYCDC